MTYQQFNTWLDKLFAAWKNQNPQSAVDLCANHVFWLETPFSTPLTTKEELLKEWNSILDQKDISVEYEVLSVTEKFGIAKWKAQFTTLSTNKTLLYEGIYQVSLNDKNECTEFHEWFNYKEL